MASSLDNLTIEQIEGEIEKEYLTALHLIHIIARELRDINIATSPGSEFEANILKNAALLTKLVEMRQLKISDLNSDSGDEDPSPRPCPHMSQGRPDTSAT